MTTKSPFVADHPHPDVADAGLGPAQYADFSPPRAVICAPASVAVAGASARKLWLLVVAAVALVALLHLTPLGDVVQDFDALYASLSGGGVRSAIYFVILTAALMTVGTPRVLFYMLGGYVFGFWGGLLLSLCASTLGCLMAFRIARWGGREWLVGRFGQHRLFRRIVDTRPTVWSVALVRLLPVSNAVINIGLALSSVGSRVFVAGTLIGFIPQGIVATLVGSGVATGVTLDGALQLGTVAIVVLSVLFWSLRRKRIGFS